MVNKHYPQCTFLQWMIRKQPYLCHLLYVADIKLLQFIQTMTFQIRMQTVTSPTTAVIQRSSINEVHSKALHVVSLCHPTVSACFSHFPAISNFVRFCWGYFSHCGRHCLFPFTLNKCPPSFTPHVQAVNFVFDCLTFKWPKLHVSVCHMFPSYMVSVRKAVWIFLNSLICW